LAPCFRFVGLAPAPAWCAVALLACGLALTGLVAEPAQAQEVAPEVPLDESGEASEPATPLALAVLPFRVNASRGTRFARPFSELLGERLAALDGVEVVGLAAAGPLPSADAIAALPDAELQQLVRRVGAAAGVSGSLTELAGSFSLDVRVTPARATARSRSIVFTAGSIEELLLQLDEVAARVSASSAEGEAPRIAAIQLEAPPDLEQTLRGLLRSKVGEPFDPQLLRSDRESLLADPNVGSVSVETQRGEDGVVLRYRIVPTAFLLGGATPSAGSVVVDIRISGNRRIEADAIRARVRTRTGEPLIRSRVAADVREIFGLGFFRNVRVYTEEAEGGVALVFDVEENPVVRQISLTGNDAVDSDDIREALTLTTGSTLDYPLLHENKARIEALYRAQGFYLAKVDFKIEAISEGSVGVVYEVEEGEKLKLRTIAFEGNEHFEDEELSEDFNIKTWKFYSLATSWFDKTGTYSEPIFLRDLREVEKKYTDAGFLQVEVGEPEVDASEDGLTVSVEIIEGPRFDVGTIDVFGDETVDLEALREKLRLSEGDVFNRSHLTADVESLESHYTDRGFYFAKVEPRTRLHPDERRVDVQFHVEKGPLYFVRRIDISGNTRTIDPVVRREMYIVEGQLYSARAITISRIRARNLGFFEDVSFEPRTTDDPSLLDLDVTAVERPTGSFSFGAGFSSQDRLVLTASLSQANLFGRGYGANLSADIGGRTNRFFLSFQDPYFLDSTFGFGTTIFVTDVRFEDFEQEQRGFDINFGHALTEDNTARIFLRYGYATRSVRRDSGVNAAGVIFREILQGNESSSTIGASVVSDTRDDRFSPTQGDVWRLGVDYAGLGGFANYFRVEGRYSRYFPAPRWIFERSAFVFTTRMGWAVPFNSISDYDFLLNDSQSCAPPNTCRNIAPLDQVDEDLKLPLTERYFLGGVGSFQLRGFRARSVGPRRAILRRSGVLGLGDLFHPIGTERTTVNNNTVAVCNDTLTGVNNQGNGNGVCNDLTDRRIKDFDDLNETDVVGGNKFIATSLEYRFPISEEVGLQGVVFADMGNAFDETQDNLFDVTDWRYGFGGGVLWFSPFGPLQVVLGFPLDPLSIEDSPVFEFSVGGAGL
jgi:outer membrane protein insertion porin family